MATVGDIFSQLQRDEGLQLKPYTDTAGKLTIGYGRNLTDNGISAGEAVVLLDNDVTTAQAALLRALPWTASIGNAARFGVLVNMTFNIGVQALLAFTTFLGYVQSGNWEAAAEDMVKTLWARQVGNRAVRLAQQMRTGEWQ